MMTHSGKHTHILLSTIMMKMTQQNKSHSSPLFTSSFYNTADYLKYIL